MTSEEYWTELDLIVATIGFNFKAATYGEMPVKAKELARKVTDAAILLAEAIQKGAPKSQKDVFNERFMRAIGVASEYAQAKNVDVLLGQVVVSINAINGFENAWEAERITDERND